jgi:nitrate reductase beta subunit
MSELISQDAKANLAKQLREQAMGLIPEDVFSEMLEKEITSFFYTEQQVNVEEVDVYNGGWSKTKEGKQHWNVTPFRQLVWTELAKLVSSRMQIFINDAFEGDEVNVEYNNTWNLEDTQSEAANAKFNLNDMLMRAMPSILNEMFMTNLKVMTTHTVQDIEMKMHDNMRNTLANHGIHTNY